MTTIKAKGFREYFRWDDTIRSAGIKIPARVRFRRWFHPFSFSLAILILCGALGFAKSFFWFPMLTLMTYLFFLYFSTKITAKNLQAERNFPTRVLHRSKVIVEIKLMNLSRFALKNLIVKDFFSLSTDGNRSLWVPESIPGGESLSLNYQVMADASLGSHNFGPLQIIVSDPLGIFEFRVIDSTERKIEVIPDPKKIIPLDPPSSLFSQPVANDVSPRAGDSTSFFELRNYTSGDSLRKISWKLSTKFQKLLVKEFEDSSSDDFTLFLDLDAKRHFGSKDLSTWQYMKEVSLAFLFGQARRRRFQVLSESFQLPFGGGDFQLDMATKGILGMEPIPEPKQSLYALAVSGRLPYGSSLLYVGPTPLDNPQSLLSQLRALQNQGVRTSLLLVDTSSFIEHERFDGIRASLVEATDRSQRALKHLQSSFRQAGVSCTILKRGDLAA